MRVSLSTPYDTEPVLDLEVLDQSACIDRYVLVAVVSRSTPAPVETVRFQRACHIDPIAKYSATSNMTALTRDQKKGEVNCEPEQQAALDKPTEDNNAQPDQDDNQTISVYAEVPRIAWEWICWSGAKTFDGMDFAGEVLANFLGLTQSKYQWILEAQEREEEEKQQRRLEKRQRRQLRLEQLLEAEQRKLQELETGALEQDQGSSETSTTV